MAKRWNGKKMSHGKKDLKRPTKAEVIETKRNKKKA